MNAITLTNEDLQHLKSLALEHMSTLTTIFYSYSSEGDVNALSGTVGITNNRSVKNGETAQQTQERLIAHMTETFFYPLFDHLEEKMNECKQN